MTIDEIFAALGDEPYEPSEDGIYAEAIAEYLRRHGHQARVVTNSVCVDDLVTDVVVNDGVAIVDMSLALEHDVEFDLADPTSLDQIAAFFADKE